MQEFCGHDSDRSFLRVIPKWRCAHAQACALRIILAILFAAVQGTAIAVASNAAAVQLVDEEDRHFDARVAFNRGYKQTPSSVQETAVAAMTREVADLAIVYSDTTGAVRSLSSHSRYLTAEKRRRDAMSIALEFLKENAAALGLTEDDLLNYEVTDRVYSKVTGATHVYPNVA